MLGEEMAFVRQVYLHSWRKKMLTADEWSDVRRALEIAGLTDKSAGREKPYKMMLLGEWYTTQLRLHLCNTYLPVGKEVKYGMESGVITHIGASGYLSFRGQRVSSGIHPLSFGLPEVSEFWLKWRLKKEPALGSKKR